MPERLEALVFGSVQGVGFRSFVQKEARRLALTGLVQNLSDGSVQIVAEGDRKKLDELVSIVSKGLPWARVKHVSTFFAPASGEFSLFEKRY